jgi:hypothetical protein
MARSRHPSRRAWRCIAAATVLLPVSACVDEPGRGWGELVVDLELAFALGPDRVDPQGRWLTAHGYALGDAHVELHLDRLRFAAASDAALPFDPATPPPGYSLCHGGHCHADDGTLPSYAEIAAALAGEGASTALEIAVGGTVAADLPASVSVAALQACTTTAPCALDRGGLGSASVHIASARVRGRVYGMTQAAAAALGPAGMPLDVELAIDGEIATALVLSVDRDATFHQALGLRLRLGAGLLDTLPLERWATTGLAADVAPDITTLRAALVHSATLETVHGGEAR